MANSNGSDGYFLKPWQPGSDGAGDPVSDLDSERASAPSAEPTRADDPRAGLPSLSVADATRQRIAAFANDVGSAGADVWQRALTCVAQGFAQCDILELLAGAPRFDDVAPEVAATLADQRTQLTEMQSQFETRWKEHAAQVARANEIVNEAHAFAMAEGLKRQQLRDQVAPDQANALDTKIAADRTRADERQRQFIAQLTQKYW